jgi:translation initiation factor IF-3
LIGPDGDNVGVVPIEEAMQIARDADLDLVEVAPNSDPPVCREIRLRPKTNEHHRNLKVRRARGWLESGMKVKVRIRFRGREITYPEIALNDLKQIAEDLSDLGVIEQAPSLEGRTMLMVLAPSKAPKKS